LARSQLQRKKRKISKKRKDGKHGRESKMEPRWMKAYNECRRAVVSRSYISGPCPCLALPCSICTLTVLTITVVIILFLFSLPSVVRNASPLCVQILVHKVKKKSQNGS
jgi:hypothetical protein